MTDIDYLATAHSLVDREVGARLSEQSSLLADVHEAFAKWLGPAFDRDAIDATLAAAAIEKLDGDPLWLLIVGGSGAAKTEIVSSLDGAGALITSTIASEGALLSATSRKEVAADASGGLLRKIGDSGLLGIKDVTSILSMSRDSRGTVLAGLREVFDGRWSRNVGTDGGKTLDWTGRIAVVGAVTTAWDKAHAVVAEMGDRFVLIRLDSHNGRVAAGRRAIGNVGSEVEMRAELAESVGRVLAAVRPVDAITPTDDETDRLLAAADLVTRARTAVEYDYRGDVIDAHALEMPTRFAKQLAQVLRGGVAVGLDRVDALRLALRCARDSMPPLRLAIVEDVAANPWASTAEVRRRLGLPRATVDRQLQALEMLGVLEMDEIDGMHRGKAARIWHYTIAKGIEPTAIGHLGIRDFQCQKWQ